MKPITRDLVSKSLDPIRKHVPSPLYLAAGIGLVGGGLGLGLWENLVHTGGSLGRYPITKLTGMSKADYDQAIDDIASDNKYRFVIPTALGLMLGGGYLASRYNDNLQGKGLLDWAPKTASIHKEADELFSYGGYVPEVDFSQVINANAAKSMFTNDPQLRQDPYVMNTGIAIINDASKRAGYSNPTLGNIYDSTVQKTKSKLSWAGVKSVAANTMIANATAHLFTGVLGAVLPLPEETKNDIIADTTWATAIASILT